MMNKQQIRPQDQPSKQALPPRIPVRTNFINVLAQLWRLIFWIWSILVIGIAVGVLGNAAFTILTMGKIDLMGTFHVIDWLHTHPLLLITVLAPILAITFGSFLAHLGKQREMQADQHVQGESLVVIAKGVQRALDELTNKPAVPHTPSSPSVSLKEDAAPEEVWNIPYKRNPFFTGREGTLAQIHTIFQAQLHVFVSQPAAISGLGGIGKTQTAIEYAYRYVHEYQYVLWVQADTRDTLTTDYVTLAHLLNLPEQDVQDSTVTVEAVKRWLTRHSGWLLIFDNADDLSFLDVFLPALPHGHILFTTRTQLIGGSAARIELEEMTEEEGTRFLLRRIGLLAFDTPLAAVSESLRTLATTLVKELDGLPLALDQAGAYIEETGCGLSRYLELYRTQQHTLLKRRSKRPTSHPEPVTTTWSLSFEHIESSNPAATQILRCCTFLHPDAIPEELLAAVVAEFSPVLQEVVRDPVQFDEAIGDLLNYSLLHRLPDTGEVSVHRLVQAVLKDDMDQATQQRWAKAILYVVVQLFPVGEVENWETCQRYLPHAMLCAEYIEQWTISSEEAARLLHNVASYLDDHAQYQEAEPLYLRALEIREQVLGMEYPETALTLNNLGYLYWHWGKYEQAEPLYLRALAIREQVLGTEHPETALTLHNLATLYGTQGKYEQAEPLYLRALVIRERVLGTEHPVTTFTLNNLGVLYECQGKYEQAEPLHLRALAIRERVLGSEHLYTAITLHNLATLYRDQGKYEQAEPLYLRALAIRKQVLVPEHPEIADTLHNLADLYDAQGKYEQAEPLYLRALAIRERVLGPEHPLTASTLHNLAELRRIISKDVLAQESPSEPTQ